MEGGVRIFEENSSGTEGLGTVAQLARRSVAAARSAEDTCPSDEGAGKKEIITWQSEQVLARKGEVT